MQVAFSKKVDVILGCFEVFIERPSARASTWSNYKHHNTAKVLIGISPQGVISSQQCQLYTPAFTRGKSQLFAIEVHETRTIANVRIHVERVVGNVKKKYSGLQSTIPIHFTTKRKEN